jgi:hypothetical protein
MLVARSEKLSVYVRLLLAAAAAEGSHHWQHREGDRKNDTCCQTASWTGDGEAEAPCSTFRQQRSQLKGR